MTGRGAEALSYAVVWRAARGPTFSGRLELARTSLVLEGSAPDGTLERAAVRYADLVAVRVGRDPDERLGGAPSLVLQRTDGPTIQLQPVDGGAGVFELGETVAALVAESAAGIRRAVVVVPFRPEALERVRELVSTGPPFDPAETGLDRHSVWLTEREAVFVFEGEGVRELAARVVRSPAAWRAAAAWRSCLDGAPRVADEAYAWARRELPAGP